MTCVKPERTWSKFVQSHGHKLETKYWTLATCILSMMNKQQTFMYSRIALRCVSVYDNLCNLNNTAPSIGTFAGRGLERS